MSVTLLAIVGAAEAVVYQQRYRATHAGWITIGVWTLATCALRVAFVGLGISVVMSDAGVLAALLAYAVPAALVTAAVRWVELRRERADMEALWGFATSRSPAEDLAWLRRRLEHPTIEEFQRAEAEAAAEARDAHEYHTFEVMQTGTGAELRWAPQGGGGA